MQILQQHQHEDAWSYCFIGIWPVYTLGYLITDITAIQLVRNDLQRRSTLAGTAQITRFRYDLEELWASRNKD
ncbi:hypothetical protein BJY01DRAFT_227460 [Aspergillus pseudoustus]|uniref:Uncharacterized protein n=1 Tax=Aspergillus pseudoustus TaxID=1810923 RepID=A0ABR4IRC5_9EURO